MALAALVSVGGTARAASTQEIAVAPVPRWVLPPPTGAPSTSNAQADAPMRFTFFDKQLRVGPKGEEIYVAYRVKIQKPEGLAVGNISLTWAQGTGSALIHRVQILRGSQVIDVLARNKFKVIQRETGLEQSILTGQLTASLQVPGLEVGDELEVVGTILQSEPAFAGHAAGLEQMPVLGTPGIFRTRLLWPERRPLVTRLSKDMPALAASLVNGEKVLDVQMTNPSGAVPTEGAPARFNVRRLIEYSDFGSWPEVSRLFSGSFEAAGRLAPGSPVKAEATRIMAAAATPTTRTELALRSVEENIRYVYVGLNGGNYRPATADETWTRKFGDCKGKTVLLMALLREMGLPAEPMLVNSNGGDGLDQRLPSPALFDHVVVRTTIEGKPVWLDATRSGDRHVALLPPPSYRWSLPVRPTGAEIEPVASVPTTIPQIIGVVEIDASRGPEVDAKVHMDDITHGDDGYQIKTAIAAMSKEDADRALKSYWRQQASWVDPTSVAWRYDEQRGTTVLSVTGTGKPEWRGSAKEGWSLTISGAGFFPPDIRRRASEQDASAPWAREYPRFRCYATTIRLPADRVGWHWTFASKPVATTLGGVQYWRRAALRGGVMRTLMSSRTINAEISAAEAKRTNDAIPGFDNDISTVSETSNKAELVPNVGSRTPFDESIDWVINPGLCLAGTTGRPF